MELQKSLFNDAAGKLLLRLVTGSLLIFHGVHKLLYGLDYIGVLLQMHGWPEFLRYGIFLGEVIAPVMLLMGIFVRIAALLIALTMLMSIYLFYGFTAFILDQYGALNSQVNIFFFITSLSIFFLGAGNYSIYKGNGKWN